MVNPKQLENVASKNYICSKVCRFMRLDFIRRAWRDVTRHICAISRYTGLK